MINGRTKSTPFPIALLSFAALLAAGVPVASAAQQTDLVEQVRAREIAFAQTMADRDFAAFATFLADEAVFFSRNRPQRGKDAVLEGWRSLFEGDEPPFSWHPDVVVVLDTGRLALSSGPVVGPDGADRGRFNSVWRLEDDGVWRVVFDKGC